MIRRCFAACAIFAIFLGHVDAASASRDANRHSIRADNEAARALLLRAGRLFQVSVVISSDVQGFVTIDLRDVTFRQVLNAIANVDHLSYRDDHDVVTVTRSNAADVIGQNSVTPNVIQLSILRAPSAAIIVRNLFPGALVRADARANALIVTAGDADLAAIRNVVQGLDVRDPTRPVVESLTLRSLEASDVQRRLSPLYKNAIFTPSSRSTLIIRASPLDLAQIKAVIASIDAPLATPPPIPSVADAISVSQRPPADIARAVSRQIRSVHAAVSGSTIVLTGSVDDVSRAKALIAAMDIPAFGTPFAVVYRLHNVDATSVADLISKSFRDAALSVDKDLNAISVISTAAEQTRIGDAISKLDSGGTAGGSSVSGDPATTSEEIIHLRSVAPSQATSSTTTTAQDIANAVTQLLQTSAPDLRIVVPNNIPELALSGSRQSLRRAEDLIEKLDVVPQSVVLDTEILELDETASKNIGLQLNSTGITSTFTEETPATDPNTGLPGRLIRLQPLSRTAISFQATVNLLLQTGNARVLADPRITTLSGRAASIRAGDTISILTTVGGGTGTVASTQLQSFQTGVQLDITPIIASDNGLMVALHPVVNSLTGFNSGVPQISTRDTQTTVHLHDNETLVIGGLIQDSVQRTTNKIPLLGDLPLIGAAFRNDQLESTRNELVIVVTPHIVNADGTAETPGPPLPVPPKPMSLPTLPPGTTLPQNNSMSEKPIPSRERPQARPSSSASASPSPAPTPSAFASMNLYTFGSPPPNNASAPGDAATIFYASFQPTVVQDGTNVEAAVITSTNVTHVRIGPSGAAIEAKSVGPGKWVLSYPFTRRAYSAGQTSILVPIVASRADGTSSTVNVPVNLSP